MRKTIITALTFILIFAEGFLHADEAGAITNKARLQRALFAEEAERDLPKAAKEYEQLVEEYTEARKIGLSALYRLAEVRRKQKRNDEAAKLYLRVVSEFPETPEARLSGGNLTALGVDLPLVPNRIPDDPDETKELRRLMMLAKNSPERMWDEVPMALNNVGNQTTSPLSKAARRGWLRVVAFLLEEHKKSGRKQRELDLALYSSARSGQVESCRLLVKNGATLAIAKYALVEVIKENHQAVGDWLLQQGVNINTVEQKWLNNLENRRYKQRDIYSGEEGEILRRTPVHMTPLSAAIEADDPEWIDRLLKLGAEVNHQGAENRVVSISPLSIACWKGHAPLVKRLLDLGADPNAPDKIFYRAKEIRQPASNAKGWRPLHYAAGKPEVVALLLAAGADAKGADAEGFTPLHAAAFLNSVKSCSMLLKAEAPSDPAAKLSWLGDKEWTPIMLASAHAKQEDGGAAAKEIIQMLIERGANPTPEVLAPRDILDLCRVIKLRFWLAKVLRYPEFARTKGITVAFPASSTNHPLVTQPDADSAPPSLAEALLGWVEPVKISGNQTYKLDRGTLRRASESGQFQKIPFEISDIESHPELRWGDVIEFSPVKMDVPADVFRWTLPRKSGKSVGLDPEAYLKLFTQMKLKITIAWSDRPRQELTLRGSLWVYDPGRAEAPLVSPRALFDLLGESRKRKLSITRSKKYGGGTIDLPMDRKLTRGIRFLDGDLVTVAPLHPEEAEEIRKKQIQLIEPKSGFRWKTWISKDGSPSKEMSGAKANTIKPAAYPTLLQFLTEFYFPLETFELQAMSEILIEEKDLKQWSPDEIARAVRLSGVGPWSTIRHPDLREIWIERLGGERVRFPLAELISKANEKTPDEFYRKADIELRPGDIVEIRLLPDHEKVPWKGFDPNVTRFIAKALKYDIKLTPTAEPQQSVQVQWVPPHWFETSAGPIAVGKTNQKPFIMKVNEIGLILTETRLKWSLKEQWLRQGAVIQESKDGRYYSGKNRMGGSCDGLAYPTHSGIDERGLSKGLRPRLNHSRASSSMPHSRVLVPTKRR